MVSTKIEREKMCRQDQSVALGHNTTKIPINIPENSGKIYIDQCVFLGDPALNIY